MEAFGCHDVGFQEPRQRLQHRAARPYGVGHRRQRDRHPLQGVTLGPTVQRLMLAELSYRIIASRLGPAQPLATAWNGAGAWLIFSQSRQLNFSRTVSTTFHWRGNSIPASGSRLRRACVSDCRRSIHTPSASDHHAFAGKMIGERIALGTRARKSAHSRRPGDGLSRPPVRSSVAAGFQLFEHKRQLVDQARRAFRSLPVDLALQLGDLQLLLGISAVSSDAFARATASSAAISRAFARSLANATFRAFMSSGRASRALSMQPENS